MIEVYKKQQELCTSVFILQEFCVMQLWINCILYSQLIIQL